MENPQRSERCRLPPYEKISWFSIISHVLCSRGSYQHATSKKKKNTKAATNSGVASIQVAPTVLCKGR